MRAVSVEGIPIPQGSKNARVVNGRAVMYEANKRHYAWRDRVAAACRLAINENKWPPLGVPVKVEMTFHLPRPASVSENQRRYPSVKPDLDKLARSVNDAAVKAGLIIDDSQIVELHLYKRYADGGVSPGLMLTIHEIQ
jgi:Holliday junction resolvase RusA-like endonuclease